MVASPFLISFLSLKPVLRRRGTHIGGFQFFTIWKIAILAFTREFCFPSPQVMNRESSFRELKSYTIFKVFFEVLPTSRDSLTVVVLWSWIVDLLGGKLYWILVFPTIEGESKLWCLNHFSISWDLKPPEEMAIYIQMNYSRLDCSDLAADVFSCLRRKLASQRKRCVSLFPRISFQGLALWLMKFWFFFPSFLPTKDFSVLPDLSKLRLGHSLVFFHYFFSFYTP